VSEQGHGEPISGGQAPRSWDELVIRFDAGIDLNRIQQLLQQARERGGLSQESVCTVNLVGIYYSTASYERAQAALEAAGTLHPCRLLVLIAEERTPTDAVTARISVVRQGGAISLERIVLTATGQAVRHLESAMLGLLLPELPLVVIWGGRAEGNLLNRAVESADRVIIDSSTRPANALIDVAQFLAAGAPLGDLAWARIFTWQALAAEVLDLPNLREHRGNITRAKVTCAGSVGPEGVLLAGWMGARIKKIKLELVAASGSDAPAPSPGGGDGQEGSGSASTAALSEGQITQFEFEAPPATFTLRREKGILVAEVRGDDDGEVVHRVRLPLETPGRLLGLELKLLAGIDDLYAASVQAGVKLIARGALQASGKTSAGPVPLPPPAPPKGKAS